MKMYYVSAVLLFAGSVLLATAGCDTNVGAGTRAPEMPRALAVIEDTRLQQPPANVSAPSTADVPRAVTPETEYKFGIMDRLTVASHEFVVRNEGTAPLLLSVGETSCKCTAGTVDGRPLAPGESTTVRMEWNTGDKVSAYRQWSSITTNDPARKEIVFYVEGLVRSDFTVSPGSLDFGDFVPGDVSGAKEVLVTSDRNREFVIGELKLSCPELIASVEPLPADRLASLKAAHGYAIQVKISGELPKGDFVQMLDLLVKPSADSEQAQAMSVPIQGRVLGRIAVMGPQINEYGEVQLGVRRYGEGRIARLKVIVRDEDPQLLVRRVAVEPEFLKVVLTPSAANSRHYDLIVQLPEDAPPCAHRGDNMARIHFEFDHPRITKLDLKADFSVRAPKEVP